MPRRPAWATFPSRWPAMGWPRHERGPITAGTQNHHGQCGGHGHYRGTQGKRQPRRRTDHVADRRQRPSHSDRRAASSLTLTAEDKYGNRRTTNYTGQSPLTSSDPKAGPGHLHLHAAGKGVLKISNVISTRPAPIVHGQRRGHEHHPAVTEPAAFSVSAASSLSSASASQVQRARELPPA